MTERDAPQRPAPSSSAQLSRPEIVAYVAERLWDGTADEVLERGAVVIEGSRIASLTPAAELPIDIRKVETGDVTLLPGLIDAHVHLTWGGSSAPHEMVAGEPAALTVLRAAQHCAQQLTAGVTTVRDLGSADAVGVELATAEEAGLLAGPHVLAAGRAIAMTGGHAHFIAREVDGADAARAGVRAELKGGAACIKLMASGGVMGAPAERPSAPQLTAAELSAAVDEAHRAGVTVAAHAFAIEAIRAAVDAGVDTIEHGSFLDDRVAEAMTAHGVSLVPTLAPIQALHSRGRELGLPDHMVTKVGELHRTSRGAVQAAMRAGVPVVAGTDAGVPSQRHGEISTEVGLLHAAGLSRLDALRAATSAAADALALTGEAGRLRPGLRGDVIAVSGNPLEDLGVLRSPTLVIKSGAIAYDSRARSGCVATVAA